MKRHRRLAEFGVVDPAFDGRKVKRYLQLGPAGSVLATVGLLFLSTAADAQSANSGAVSNSSSSRMWGGAGPSGNALDSATMHALDGNAAGQVNAAKQGLLLNAGPGMSITSIGSQNIVSNTIIGDNNSINVNANQNSSNSGDVSNHGTITPK